MNTCEVYAANIQKGQLKAVLPPYKHTPEEMELLRQNFLDWLLEQEEAGILFEDQCEAWHWYVLYTEPVELEDEEFEGKSWQEEIEEIMDKVVNSKDFLANYNYEAGRGLPAQQ